MEIKNYFAQDLTGNVIANAVVYLYLPGTQTLAQGLKDAAGAPLDNPFRSDSAGRIQVAAPDGVYDIRVSGGLRDYKIERVQFLDLAAAKSTAVESADAAKAARAAAEAARDALQATAAIYPTTAAGIAATPAGKYFSVPSADEKEHLILYFNQAGVATEVKRYPSARLASDYGNIARTFSDQEYGVAERPIRADSNSAANKFSLWGVGFTVNASVQPSSFTVRSNTSATLAKVRLKLWSRPLATGDASATLIFPGAHASDVLLSNRDYTLAEVGLIADDLTFRNVRFDVTSWPALQPGFIYFTEFSGLAADGVTPVGIGCASGISQTEAAPNWSRGWYSIAPSSTRALLSAVGNQTMHFKFAGRRTAQGFVSDRLGALETASGLYSYGEVLRHYEVKQAGPYNAIQSTDNGRYISTPKFVIAKAGGDLVVNEASLLVNVVAAENIADEPFRMQYNGRQFLSLQYVEAITKVVRVSDNALLTRGVDYDFNPNTGRVWGLINTETFDALVSFTGRKHRYDLIYADALTGAVGVTVGSNRGQDPDNFRPAIPSGKIPLFSMYVYPGNVELIPVFQFRNYVKLNEKAQVQDWLEYCRQSLPRTFSKLRRGLPIKLAGYGDSITAGGGSTANQLIPNYDRDLTQFYDDRADPAVVAAWPKWDNEYGTDFHVKLGWNWYLAAAMSSRYGSPVEYLNFGVGGTSSANTANASGSFNGLYPDRINALIAAAPDVVVIGFGMNEIGMTTTYGNIRAIVQQLKAAGIESIVIPQPMTNEWDAPNTIANWLYTHDAIVRAALDENVAYLSTAAIEAPGREGATGLSRKTASQINCYNHPGVQQLKCIGEYLAKIID